ncbi:MAG: hypothetical protein HKN21_14555 [Candidatus Eisenbacteria bacterium]|uniref:Exo-alpha-sialidase n=1 Tax=Eiseniibacteriota bacterium TaxID=2212470 RepID=A0A7Y2EA05_UNCEI|nr:hypothetical protein [Candidatus Eisenbacteria bacterium]
MIYSPDKGETWHTVTTDPYYCADFNADQKAGWLAGPNGVVARFTLR